MATRTGISTIGTPGSRTSSAYSASVGRRPQQAQARSASASSKAPLALWGLITGAWLLLISGLFEEQLGTPGLVQVFRLKAFLAEKQGAVHQLESELAAIESAIQRMDQSPVLLEREIRRTLGYVAPGDLIFDFTASESATGAPGRSVASPPGRE